MEKAEGRRDESDKRREEERSNAYWLWNLPRLNGEKWKDRRTGYLPSSAHSIGIIWGRPHRPSNHLAGTWNLLRCSGTCLPWHRPGPTTPTTTGLHLGPELTTRGPSKSTPRQPGGRLRWRRPDVLTSFPSISLSALFFSRLFYCTPTMLSVLLFFPSFL